MQIGAVFSDGRLQCVIIGLAEIAIHSVPSILPYLIGDLSVDAGMLISDSRNAVEHRASHILIVPNSLCLYICSGAVFDMSMSRFMRIIPFILLLILILYMGLHVCIVYRGERER